MSTVCDNLLIAYPPIGTARAQRIAELSAERVIVSLDSLEAIDALGSAARDARREIGVYIEVDLGMRRVGTQNPAVAVQLAQGVTRHRWLDFAGIAFYPGHIREAPADQGAELAQLSKGLGDFVTALERAGLFPAVVSGGSTPTLWRSHEIGAITELRPGSYVYNDRATAQVGACDWSDCALTILATVVSTAVAGQAVVDAGSKALGREPIRGADRPGYGQLLEYPEVIVTRMSEEHGMLDIGPSEWRPRIGDQVRIIPNHACVAVHLQDIMYGVTGGDVTAQWEVAARGRARVPVGPVSVARD